MGVNFSKCRKVHLTCYRWERKCKYRKWLFNLIFDSNLLLSNTELPLVYLTLVN